MSPPVRCVGLLECCKPDITFRVVPRSPCLVTPHQKGCSAGTPLMLASANATLPPLQAVEQVISALHVIQGLDGSDRGKRKIQQVRPAGMRHKLGMRHMCPAPCILVPCVCVCAHSLHLAPPRTRSARCYTPAAACRLPLPLLLHPHTVVAPPLLTSAPLHTPAAARQLQLLPPRPAGAGLRCAGRLGLASHGALMTLTASKQGSVWDVLGDWDSPVMVRLLA